MPRFTGLTRMRIAACCLAAIALAVGSCECDDSGSTGSTATPSTMTAIGGDNQTAPGGSALQPVIVEVLDASENPLSGIDVEWTTDGGTVDPTTSTTDASGHAQTVWTLPTTPGSYTATASISNPVLTTSFTAEATAPCTPTGTATLQEDFSVGNQWSANVFQIDGTASHTEGNQATGGNPGGYRQMTHTIGPPAGTSGASYIWVEHLYSGGTYDPSTSGEVCDVVYSEDQIDFSLPTQVMWGLIIEQGGHRFISRPTPQFNFAVWTHAGPYTLRASDFSPAPGPDFSTSGGVMTFGYFRANSTSTNPTTTSTIEHGIDNWRFDIRHK
ncbi:MAG TPA: Ig-like domain-containing protein [Gemmatimonadales bacterium]|jgi:hypothetical protein